MFKFGNDYTVNQLIADLFVLFEKLFDLFNGKDDALSGIEVFDDLGLGAKK